MSTRPRFPLQVLASSRAPASLALRSGLSAAIAGAEQDASRRDNLRCKLFQIDWSDLKFTWTMNPIDLETLIGHCAMLTPPPQAINPKLIVGAEQDDN